MAEIAATLALANLFLPQLIRADSPSDTPAITSRLTPACTCVAAVSTASPAKAWSQLPKVRLEVRTMAPRS